MKTIEIFIYDQAAGLDVMGPLEVFSAANFLRHQSGQKPAYNVRIAAAQKGLVTLSGGVQLHAMDRLTAGTALDYLVVVGGLGYLSQLDDAPLMKRLSDRCEDANKVVSICTGAFLLAEIGLLDGKSCTTHWRCVDELAQRYSSVEVNPDAIYVEDQGVFSSAGVTAGIDLALALVEQDYGAALALDVARDLVLYLRRPGGQSQFSAPQKLRHVVGDDFSALHDWLMTDLQRVVSVELMASFCSMSPRNFARKFVEKTSLTPARYLENLRVERARELLESTTLSIEAISSQAGFWREERMRRSFLKVFGVTPTIYRSHFGQQLRKEA
ncbi:MAG: GlxA family transcriptional regulator [Cellvibrionaceae bacterium]